MDMLSITFNNEAAAINYQHFLFCKWQLTIFTVLLQKHDCVRNQEKLNLPDETLVHVLQLHKAWQGNINKPSM